MFDRSNEQFGYVLRAGLEIHQVTCGHDPPIDVISAMDHSVPRAELDEKAFVLDEYLEDAQKENKHPITCNSAPEKYIPPP
jgi:hypothetical protein